MDNLNSHQQGYGLVILIIGLAIIAVIIGLYFTKSGSKQQSQFETGQDAIEQAREINQQGSTQSRQIQEQLDLQTEANIY